MLIFVILQYNLSEKTIKAIESIKKNTELDWHIIVVDNCSTNDAFTVIKERYEEKSYITLIQTENNLGFANGNNFGVSYALEHFDFNYICVLNNDIYIQTPITVQMLQEWKQSRFDVMGPDIYRKDTNEHQNPLPSVNYNFVWLYSFYTIYNIYRILNVFRLDALLHKLAIFTLEKMNKNKNKEIKIQETQLVNKLHGSFLVFSNDFLKTFPKPFHPSTFMYLEEDFLALRCQRANAIVLYYPKLRVNHDHGSTVTTITKTDHEKRKYIFKNNSNSFRQLIKYYKSSEI